MIDLFALFWTVMIFTSISWYGFLVFYVGFKGGREIGTLTRTLAERNQPEPKSRTARSSRGPVLNDLL